MTEEIFDYKKECSSLLAEKNALLCRYEEIRAELRSLEQENEKLRKANEISIEKVTVTAEAKRLQELEQENKELKDKITALEDKLQLRMASDKESDEFWDEIFSAEDYPFNKENAYKELKDYYFVLEQIPKIYMEITGGTLSKTTYFASSVVEAYNDALDRYYDKIDDLEYNNNNYRSALEEINLIIDELKQQYDYMSDYSEIEEIETKIKEVLGND